MQKQSFTEAIDEIVAQDQRYDAEAYSFVREGLDFTVKMLKKNTHSAPEHRHVSGQELLEGLRRYALEQFGPMTKTVLEHWGIRQCSDFGELVFNMVEKGVLGKTEKDSREDFKAGYDFDEAFVRPYRPTHRPGARRPSRSRHGSNESSSRHARNPLTPGSETLSSGSN